MFFGFKPFIPLALVLFAYEFLSSFRLEWDKGNKREEY